MTKQLPNPRASSGRFAKGQSGNPNGRPKGSSGHAAELRRQEQDALKLAANTADVIAKTARLAMVEIEMPELTPLFDAICDGVKDEVNAGQIGPSSLASLRAGYDDLQESELAGAFFLHVGLPANCEWEVFKTHYWLRGRIDFKRHANDLRHFPPIAKALVDAA